MECEPNKNKYMFYRILKKCMHTKDFDTNIITVSKKTELFGQAENFVCPGLNLFNIFFLTMCFAIICSVLSVLHVRSCIYKCISFFCQGAYNTEIVLMIPFHLQPRPAMAL